jgi:hypothetical protein
MTTIQAQIIGDSALVPRSDFDRLLELARRIEAINLDVRESGDVSTRDIMQLADQGGAFEFWREPGEDIYSLQDGEPLQ